MIPSAFLAAALCPSSFSSTFCFRCFRFLSSLYPDSGQVMERGTLEDLLLLNLTVDLDANIILPIIRDVVSGLLFLHKADPPCLHNDLKPANILLDAQFSAKVPNLVIFHAAASETFSPCPAPFD